MTDHRRKKDKRDDDDEGPMSRLASRIKKREGHGEEEHNRGPDLRWRMREIQNPSFHSKIVNHKGSSGSN